jgi:multiple sugar transport system substrate-binding protein
MTERNNGSGVRAGRRINRRDFLKMSGAGLAGAALLGASGCGGGGAGSGNIIFSMGPDDANKTYTKLVDKFNEQHKGEFQVTIRAMPANSDQYFDKLRTEFQAGGGDIDVLGGDVIWPIQFAAQGWVQDLSDKFPEPEQNKFLPAPINASIYEDGIYAVPWFEDAGLIYSRSDLLEQAGYSAPPETWDELKEMALKITQDTGTPNGFVFQGKNYEGGVCDALEYIRTHGGPRDVSQYDRRRRSAQSRGQLRRDDLVPGVCQRRGSVPQGMAEIVWGPREWQLQGKAGSGHGLTDTCGRWQREL